MTVRNDLTIYDTHATEWWNEASPEFRSLHRVQRLRASILDEWAGDEIVGRRVVDLGCGGGLMSEALAERGATVVGIDRSVPSLRAARDHVGSRPDADIGARVRYVVGDLRRVPLPASWADGVVLADVLEHLDRPHEALDEAARLLRTGGWLYASTINRTWRARALAVHLAEGLGFIPKGTHDPRLFVRPDELRRIALDRGLLVERLVGEVPDLWSAVRHRAVEMRSGRSTAIAYSVLLRKVVA